MIHAAALAILPFSQLPPAALIAGAALVVSSYRRQRRLQVLRRAPQAIIALRRDSGNHWWLHLHSGETLAADLLPARFIQPWLVILYLRTEQGRTVSVMLLSDMLEPDDFRKLRVRLLTEMQPLARPGAQ